MRILLILTLVVIGCYADEQNFNINFNNEVEKQNLNIPKPKLSKDIINEKDIRNFFNELSNLFGIEEKTRHEADEFAKSFEVYEVVTKLDLNPVKNKYLYPKLFFKTSRGSIVYVSVSKSVNCSNGNNDCNPDEKFFLTFTSNNKTQVVKIKDVLNFSIFMSGQKEIDIDGEKYRVKVYGSTKVDESRIEISKGKVIVLTKKLGEVKKEFGKLGLDLKISKSYKVLYGNKLVCKLGGCSFINENMAFMVEYPLTQSSYYYSFDENHKRVYYNSIGENYLFTLDKGFLIVEMKR